MNVNPTPLNAQAANRGFRPGQAEAVNEDLYDYQTYANAGQTQLTFFNTPISGTKTLADTNMSLAGQLPNGNRFEIRRIEIEFFSGVLPGLGQQNSAAATGIDDFANDLYTVMKSGSVTLTLLNKPYLRFAPIGKAPVTHGISGAASSSDTTTAAAAQLTRTSYWRLSGEPLDITPVNIEPNMNFGVSINWPSAVALPSGIDGRIGVILRGILTRSSQ